MSKEKILKTLHMMVGLPRSGKSTIAKELGFPIVEPDSIRKSVHGQAWLGHVEPLIWGIASIMVQSLFAAGHCDVILDATNCTKKRRQIWESKSWTVQYHLIDTSEEVCIERAIDSKQKYLIPIIKRMASSFEPIGNSEDC